MSMRYKLTFPDMGEKMINPMAMYHLTDNFDDIDDRIRKSLPDTAGYRMIRNLGISKIRMKGSGGKVNIVFVYERESGRWNAIDCSYEPKIEGSNGGNTVDILIERGDKRTYFESLKTYQMEDGDSVIITGPRLDKDGYKVVYSEYFEGPKNDSKPFGFLNQKKSIFSKIVGNSHESKKIEMFR